MGLIILRNDQIAQCFPTIWGKISVNPTYWTESFVAMRPSDDVSRPHLAGGPGSPLQTVDRALEILSSFDELRTDWGVSELARSFGLSVSTAQRLLASLSIRGFLYCDPVPRRYRLGPAVWRMASLWERTGGLAALCYGHIRDVARATGANCIVAVPDGAYLRCVASSDGNTGPMRAQSSEGELYPAHAGATSRAYFAFLSTHERRDILAALPLAKYSRHTLTDVTRIEAEFDVTVEQGWAFSNGEFDASTQALAVPVMAHNRPVGSLSLGQRKTPGSTDLMQHLPLLLDTARELGNSLSSRRPRHA